MWDFRHNEAIVNCCLIRKKAARILHMCSFYAFVFFFSPTSAQDIGPKIYRAGEEFKLDEIREYEVSKAGYNIGVAAVGNGLTGNLADYYSIGAGAELSMQFFNEKATFCSVGMRLSFNQTLGVILPADTFPQMNVAPLGSFSFGVGKRFEKFHLEGVAQLAFFSIRGRVSGDNGDDILAENLNSAMFGAKISYPIKSVLGNPKVVFGYDDLPHYHETRMNLWFGYYHGLLFNKAGFSGGIIELGLTFQFNRYQLKSFKR